MRAALCIIVSQKFLRSRPLDSFRRVKCTHRLRPPCLTCASGSPSAQQCSLGGREVERGGRGRETAHSLGPKGPRSNESTMSCTLQARRAFGPMRVRQAPTSHLRPLCPTPLDFSTPNFSPMSGHYVPPVRPGDRAGVGGGRGAVPSREDQPRGHGGCDVVGPRPNRRVMLLLNFRSQEDVSGRSRMEAHTRGHASRLRRR